MVVNMLDEQDPIVRAADRLIEASRSYVACAPVRELIGRGDASAAYAVQQRVVAARARAGARAVGRKIGLTAPAVQAQLGVDRPDFGILFDDMARPDRGLFSTATLLQPKVEAEIAFVLDEDLVGSDVDESRVRRAVGSVHAALEIVDSRIENWDISFADTVADNGSSAGYVLGASSVPMAEIEPVGVEMVLRRDGEVVSQGSGTDCLGDPLRAVAWLARLANELGDPLRAGDLVLSGALGPMVVASPGNTFSAELTGLGSVTVSFTAEDTP